MNDTSIEILLVEDNPNDVELTLRAFNQNNLTNPIYVVRDGEEALDYLFCRGEYSGRNPKDGPKLILLDLKLPKVDGLEVLRQIKGDPGLRTTPVVVLTSSSEERDILESYQVGVNSYIVKPVDFEQFLEFAKTIGMYWTLINKPPIT